MSNKVISFLLPTRGRQELVKRFFASIVDTTAKLDRIEVVLYLDEDDIDSHYLDSGEFLVARIIGPALSMGGYNSACLAKAQGDVVILANDDMVIRTKGWDDLVLSQHKEFEDQIYLAYANDLFKTSKFCTFPIMSRRTCELLVEPYPAAYRRAFIDVHLYDIFMRLKHAGFDRMRYREDLVFEHLHYRSGKAPYDDTYGYARDGRFSDDPVYLALTTARSVAAKRLADVIGGNCRADVSVADLEMPMPKNTPSAVIRFARLFLFDSELPLGWRLYLWYWFIGRYLAANGYLRWFVR